MIIDGVDQAISQLDTQPDSDVIITSEIQEEITRLQNNLQSLLDTEVSLFAELNGGLCGRASTYVRTGWQSLISSPPRSSIDTLADSSPAATHAWNSLLAARDSMEALWHHPLVGSLVSRHKLKIEESAPLYESRHFVPCSPYSYIVLPVS